MSDERPMHPMRLLTEGDVARSDRVPLPPPQPWVERSLVEKALIALVIVLPNLIAGIYYAVFAADRYVAEAKLVARPVGGVFNEGESVKAMAERKSGIEAYVIENFLHSRNLVRVLDRDGQVRAFYGRSEAGLFDGIGRDASEDRVWLYLRQFVTARIDTTSDIITLRVQAFRREDALRLCREIVQEAVRAAWSFSERAREDGLRASQRDLDNAAGRFHRALVALQEFRDRTGYVAPLTVADSWGKLVVSAEQERIKLAIQRASLASRVTPSSPVENALAARETAAAQQVVAATAPMLNPSDAALSTAAIFSKFEELELERQFSERLYSFYRKGNEEGRARSAGQQVAVSVFLEPTVSQSPAYPQRLLNMSLIATLSILVWGVFRVFLAVLRDTLMLRHR